MKSLNDILGYKNRKIYQDDECFSFSLDSVILANFVTLNKKINNILDLGTGNGVIPLILSLRTKKNIIGIEIQEKLSLLAQESVDYNELDDQINIINCDMKKFVFNKTINSFDVITCNPPYFKFNDSKFVNNSKEKMIARHEICIKLEEILDISKKLLKDGGRLAMVLRTDRFLEVVDLFRKYKIEPKRISFIYEKEKKQSILFFIEGVKMGKSGLIVENPFILYNNDGSYTEMYNKLISEVNL